MTEGDHQGNLVPRVSHFTAPGGGKMIDPGNEVVIRGVIKGQTLGELTGCEDYFTCLV